MFRTLFFLSVYMFSAHSFADNLLDIRQAQITTMGYTGIHFKNLHYAGQPYEVTLKLNLDASWQLVNVDDASLQTPNALDLRNAKAIPDTEDTVVLTQVLYDQQSYNITLRIHLDGTWLVTAASFANDIQALEIPEDFSYQTQRDVKVQIQVTAPGGNPMQRVSVKLYIPAEQASHFSQLSLDEETEPSEDTLEEIFIGEGQTDEQGVFSQNLSIPAYVTHVRVVASAIGLVESSVDLPVTGSELTHTFVNTPAQRPARNTQLPLSSRRANDEWLYRHQVLNNQLITGEFTSNVFDNGGQLLGGYAPTINLSDELLNKISIALPDRRNVSQQAPYYITDDSGANLLVSSEGEVTVTFVHDGAGYKNSFGFFTYPDGNPPSSRDDITPIVIFPNSSYHNAGGNSNGLYTGDTVSLGSFPAGTRIGFFVVANGWFAPNSNRQGGIKPWMTPQHNWVFHTVAGLNSEPAPSLDATGNPNPGEQDLRHHTVLLDAGEDVGLVLGIEDIRRTARGCDHDFNDIIFIVNANPVTAIDRSELVKLPDPIDTDNDGIFDANDAFPEDPELAFTSYYPSKEQVGTLAFEDLWPQEGDYDLNDLVLRYQVEEVLNAQQQVKRIKASFALMARGADYDHGFAMALGNVPSNTTTQASITWNDGEAQTLSQELGHNELVYILMESSHAHSVPAAGCDFFNTEAQCRPAEQGSFWTAEWTFEQAQAREPLGYPPYNPFIYLTQNRSLEVHLPDQAPTAFFDTTRFGTQDDSSNSNQARYFKTAQNLPWALNIPTPWNYPLERIDITQTYPRFGQWTQSGGQEARDWYLEGIEEAFLY